MTLFIFVYNESDKTQHVLTRLFEEWENNLRNDYIIGAVLMDLPNVFDCILPDLVIAKLAAYEFGKKYVKLHLLILTK